MLTLMTLYLAFGKGHQLSRTFIKISKFLPCNDAKYCELSGTQNSFTLEFETEIFEPFEFCEITSSHEVELQIPDVSIRFSDRTSTPTSCEEQSGFTA